MAVLTERDASIICQVAFKAAVETSPVYVETSPVYGDDVDGRNFERAFSYYQESLTAAVKAAMDSALPNNVTIPPTAPAAVNVDPAAVLNRELGATPVIEVVNKDGQQGPFPEWFLAAAAKDGVTRIFDNRHDLGPSGNRPWFKQALTREQEAAGVEAKVYWPPR